MGWINNLVDSVLVLYAIEPSVVPSSIFGSQAEMIPECGMRSNP